MNSIAEYTLENSVIKPTYMLTYESATELLYMNLEEEEELRILQEAASIRAQWRHSQVCAKSAFLLIYNASLHGHLWHANESTTQCTYKSWNDNTDNPLTCFLGKTNQILLLHISPADIKVY